MQADFYQDGDCKNFAWPMDSFRLKNLNNCRRENSLKITHNIFPLCFIFVTDKNMCKPYLFRAITTMIIMINYDIFPFYFFLYKKNCVNHDCLLFSIPA